jgi:hypothetical protein
MRSRSLVLALASGALVAVVAACGSAASSPSSSSGAAPSAAAPSSEASLAASEAAPSAAAPSEAASASSGSGGAGSFALPSFSLPSEAKDLEALLPDQLCGAKATKASLSGASLASSGAAEFVAGLQQLGKTPNDVTFAFAFSTSGCGAGIFRVAGVDQGQLQSVMLAAVQKGGETATQATVGGKSVFVTNSSSGGGKQYVYFHGDAVIFATAADDTQGATILQALP